MSSSRKHMPRWCAALLCACGVIFAAAGTAHAQLKQFSGNLMDDVGIDQKFDSQVPLDLQFVDDAGNPVRLGEFFGDKPILLNLVYLECPRLCKLSMYGLVRSLRAMELSAGRDFSILTVSFDPREGPEIAGPARRRALQVYDREGAAQGWHFLTGEAEAIDALTTAVGFRVAYDQKLNQYAHAAGLIFLTPDGRVSRYLNGVEYAAADMRLALVEASGGGVGSPSDQVLLFCYQYNAQLGKYGWVIDPIIKIFGLGTVALLAGGILIMLRREYRQRRTLLMTSDQ